MAVALLSAWVRRRCSLAALVLGLTAACSTSTEPPALLPYANRTTRECGLHRTGGPRSERTLLDRRFEPLEVSDPRDLARACKEMGYRYVGELPASTRPCYPALAPFLGASCAPLVWIHLATIVVAFVTGGTLLAAILKRRSTHRRAMEAAGRDR